MKQTLTCVSVVQNQRGVVQFAAIDEKTKQPKNDVLIHANFKDPDQAKEFENGKQYEITFAKKK